VVLLAFLRHEARRPGATLTAMPKSKGRKKPRRSSPQAPPPPAKEKVSPTWYVALMFSLMAIGAIVIILNYIGLLPGGTDNNWLFVGLGAIGIGFLMTMNYH
jgi:hypothetical protein